eukprot:9503888-Pyramimonas_sp.AAC.1
MRRISVPSSLRHESGRAQERCNFWRETLHCKPLGWAKQSAESAFCVWNAPGHATHTQHVKVSVMSQQCWALVD